MKISELKEAGRTKLSGTYFKCILSSLFYFIIILIFNSLLDLANANIKQSVIMALIQALYAIITWILGYGILANILELVEQKTKSVTNFLNITIKNAVKYVKVGLRVILKLIIPIVILFFAGFYLVGTLLAYINKIQFLCFNPSYILLAQFAFIVALVIFLFFALDYALVGFIYYDDNNTSAKEIAEKSKRIMKGNKSRYILLYLSYFIWFLIASIVLMLLNMVVEVKYLTPVIAIFFAVLKPHLTMAKYEFYSAVDVKEEKIKKEEIKE